VIPVVERIKKMQAEMKGTIFCPSILSDLQGPKFRTGELEGHKPVELIKGETIKLVTGVFQKVGNAKCLTTGCTAYRIHDWGREWTFSMIGGIFSSFVYYTHDEVRQRANRLMRVSDMVLNHLVAMVLLVEQLYRAVTIIIGIPFHKE